MMTNDLSLNDKHVFISNLVIDSRQTDLRLVVDRLLTSVFVQQENNSKDLLEENNDRQSLNRKVRVLSSFTEDIQQSVIFNALQFNVRSKNSKSSRDCDSNFVKQFDHRSSNDHEKNQSQSFYNSINDTLNKLKLSIETYRTRTIE